MKNTFLAIAFLVVIIFSFRCGKSCNRCKPCKYDTTILSHIDTIHEQTRTDTFYKPVIKEKIIYDTLGLVMPPEPYVVDTQAILKDYLSKIIYADTQKIKYGEIIIFDTITKNRIAGRRLITSIDVPTITNTIIKEQKKRNQIYLGVNGLTDLKQDVYLGFSGLLKNKRDAIWEIGALYGTNKNIYIFGSRKFLITFKK